MNRSTWKGPFISYFLYKEIKNKTIYTKCRQSTILPFLLGKKAYVYNGKFYIPLFIAQKMLGFKFGQYSISRNLKKNGSKSKSK